MLPEFDEDNAESGGDLFADIFDNDDNDVSVIEAGNADGSVGGGGGAW